jgi:hypothetical protein
VTRTIMSVNNVAEALSRAEARLRQLDSAWVRIGVTGHRRIGNPGPVRAEVGRALDRAQELVAHPGRPVAAIEVISPLAEGADRLVVQEALKRPASRLVVPLPLDREEYERDCVDDASRAEFDQLLARASEVITLPAARSRIAAYAAAGRYVVDRCDVLLALRDGRPTQGHGGTAEIVAHAVEMEKLVIWIETSRH